MLSLRRSDAYSLRRRRNAPRAYSPYCFCNITHICFRYASDMFSQNERSFNAFNTRSAYVLDTHPICFARMHAPCFPYCFCNITHICFRYATDMFCENERNFYAFNTCSSYALDMLWICFARMYQVHIFQKAMGLLMAYADNDQRRNVVVSRHLWCFNCIIIIMLSLCVRGGCLCDKRFLKRILVYVWISKLFLGFSELHARN